MRLWAGTSEQFIQDTIQNQIAEKLKNAFFDYYRYNPPLSELNSWRNSLRAIEEVFYHSNLMDHGVILEYQLPLTSKRLDCLICGKDGNFRDNAVIIELKQWERCEEAEGENEVLTWVGGAKREVLHPSVQVGQYHMYLMDLHTAFHEGENPIRLSSCSYLHNYNYYSADVIFSEKFKDIINQYPLFTADDFDKIRDFLIVPLRMGQGIDVLKRIEESKYRPCKILMDHVSNVIKYKLIKEEIKILGHLKGDYILLDNQMIAYDMVLASIKKAYHDKQKRVIIIKGGPGTGKSVIALKLLADLNEKHYNAQYVTGSKAFTETLKKIVGSRAAAQFKYTSSYVEAGTDVIDILICDEAHRIREKTILRNRRSSGLRQIEELIRAARVCVFLIDEDQIIRPKEVGSVDLIKLYANLYRCKISEYELEAQFRCQGSEAFVNWINNTLGIQKTANVIWNQHEEEFDFKIFASPFDLENAIKAKIAQGFTARMTAGFCWSWSKDTNSDGTLKNDVVIGDFARPWNARHNATGLAHNIPKAHYWAYDPKGVNQIGCIYTAQGFEFDYVGVIFGNDLVYNFDKPGWEGHPENSKDPEVKVKNAKDQFVRLLKNTYRVLLTRGMIGCYVYFIDKETERFFKSRIEY